MKLCAAKGRTPIKCQSPLSCDTEDGECAFFPKVGGPPRRIPSAVTALEVDQQKA